VRHTLGAPFSGETMFSDWVLADTHMNGYPFPDTEVAVYWAREGVLPIFPIAPGRYRIIANFLPSGGDHPRDPTVEEIEAIDAVLTPRDLALLISWKNDSAAQAYEGARAPKSAARVRDYGKYDRREAPQYYADAKGAKTVHA
jgi:hypothetical protein